MVELLKAPISSRDVIEKLYNIVVFDKIPGNLGFLTALPGDWVAYPLPDAKVPNADMPMLPIARARPGTGAREELELVVWAVFVPREIHGSDWLRLWMKSQGFRLLEFREAVSPFGLMGDALASRFLNGTWRLHRLSTVKDGNILFLIDGRIPAREGTDYVAAQEVFLLAASRFRLIAPTGRRFAEAFQWVELPGDAKVRMLISVHWRQTVGLDAPLGGVTNVFANIKNDEICGTMIAVLGGAMQNPDYIEKVTLLKLSIQGYSIIEKDIVKDFKKGSSSIKITKCYGKRGLDKFEISSASFDMARVPVCIVLVSPVQEERPEDWAVNRRSFEIAIESLSLRL